MKKKLFSLLALLTCQQYFSQLSGTITIPSSTYTSLATAITAVNQQGVSGQLNVQINAGYIETAPVGGYSLTASGNSTAQIIFQKIGTGSNPLIMAYSGGNGTPGSMNQDGIWRLIGSDYITIDGIDLLDTNATNPASMEFGYGLFKMNGGNGCWNNCIRNCTITLNRINNASGASPAMDGSRGIDVVNAVSNAHNSVLTVSTVAGSHSYNQFYGNKIQNCNHAITMIGYADVSPYTLVDRGNEIGSAASTNSNVLINFGGGGTVTASAAIRTLAQYDLLVQNNFIDNNDGLGYDHAATLRGIYLGAAAGANASVKNNTLSLHSAGTNNQFSVIENFSGSSANSNTIAIENNLILNCSYNTAVSPSYYGIWNSASPSVLSVKHNSFVNNSSSASSGSTYLIYNNGAVTNLISIANNQLGFVYNGSNPYSGTFYSINNSNGTTSTSLNISNNNFANYFHVNAIGSGNIYFINNTNDSYTANFSNNTFTQLNLNHIGSEYLIYNSSSTQSLLTVGNNSIVNGYWRNASAGAMYGYYANGNSPATSVHSIVTNNFSNITSTVSGTGVFYGIYCTDGSSSPYPKKLVSQNVISNILINSTGNFYGLYLDNSGDASGTTGSELSQNTISNINRGGNIYGCYVASSISPAYELKIYENQILNLNSNGNSSLLYGTYFSTSGAGANFYQNRIAEIIASGTAAVVSGVYATGTSSVNLNNNLIGNLFNPNSSATNALNGIYINSGSLANLFYNTVYVNAQSTGGNFNSNGLYASSTVSLNLKNCIMYNLSSGGTGVSAVIRRSSTTNGTYLTSSNNNLFYAGTPGSTHVILQNGSTAYQTLSALQTSLSPRESSSLSQTLSFLSLNSSSPNFLHLTANTVNAVESAATAITGISTDIDTETRQGNSGYSGTGTAPDIGADEFELNLNPCTSANGGTISTNSLSICSGQTVSLVSSGYNSGTGLQHQWKISTVSGGPYTNLNMGTGFTTPEYYSPSLNTGTYYYVLETICPNASMTSVSSQATVVVNALPTATLSVNANTICAGQMLQLNAIPNINCSYYWLGPNAFYSYSQNPAIANVSSLASGEYSLYLNANNCFSQPQTVSVNVSQISATLTAIPQVLCSGNTSTLNVSGSNTYSWNTGQNTSNISVTPTQTTIYSVQITNTANCTATKQITISVISPSISASGKIICGNSGTVSLSAQAFSSSTIQWYATLGSSLSIYSGATFTAAITSDTTFYAMASQSLSGCSTSMIPISVTLSPFPTLSVSATSAIVCPGNTTTLNVSGASTYSWVSLGSGAKRVVSPTTQTTYTVIGKNSYSCSSSQTILVAILPSPTITAIQSATAVCPSSNLSFTASGAVSYTWSNGAMGLSTTVTPATNSTYTVYGSNAEGCVSSITLAITTRSVPLITIKQSADSVCPGQLITFTASGASSYTWLPDYKTGTTFSVHPLVSSVFNAIGKSVNSCTQVAFATVKVDVCTGIQSQNEVLCKIEVYPNPTHSFCKISFSASGTRRIRLYDSRGLLILDSICTIDFTEIDFKNKADGMYYLHIMTDSGPEILKIIKD